MAKKGDRVAVLLEDGTTLYGTYEGEEIPPEDDSKGWLYKLVVEAQHENPKIRLDDGRIVWGCECWWKVM